MSNKPNDDDKFDIRYLRMSGNAISLSIQRFLEKNCRIKVYKNDISSANILWPNKKANVILNLTLIFTYSFYNVFVKKHIVFFIEVTMLQYITEALFLYRAT